MLAQVGFHSLAEGWVVPQDASSFVASLGLSVLWLFVLEMAVCSRCLVELSGSLP